MKKSELQKELLWLQSKEPYLKGRIKILEELLEEKEQELTKYKEFFNH